MHNWYVSLQKVFPIAFPNVYIIDTKTGFVSFSMLFRRREAAGDFPPAVCHSHCLYTCDAISRSCSLKPSRSSGVMTFLSRSAKMFIYMQDRLSRKTTYNCR